MRIGMADIKLVEPQHMRPDEAAARGARRNGGDPRVTVERCEIDGVEGNGLERTEAACRIGAAASVGGAVHFREPRRTRAFVERVDVLRHEEELTPALRLPLLQGDKSLMCRVRAGGEDAEKALAVPAPRANRIGGEVAQRRQLGDIVCPDRARVAAAKCRDATGDTDPGTGEHDE